MKNKLIELADKLGKSLLADEDFANEWGVIHKVERELYKLAESLEPTELEKSAQLAEELVYSLRDLDAMQKSDTQDQLNCGLHMISIYENLIKSIEENMHPAYVKNLNDFRSTFVNKWDKK